MDDGILSLFIKPWAAAMVFSIETPDFRALLESAPDPYLILDRDFIIIGATDAYLRATMTRREGILGLSVFDVFPDNPDDRQADGAVRYLIHRVEDVTEFIRLKHQGVAQGRPNESVNPPAPDAKIAEAGEPGGGRHGADAHENLRLKEALYRSAIETTSDGFLEGNRDGRIMDVNEALTKLTGYSREELLTMEIAMLDAVESPEQTTEHLKKILERGQDRFETLLRRKDGRTVPVEVSVSFRRDTGLLFGFIRDVTEHKRDAQIIADYVRQLESMMDETLIAVSHMVEKRDPYTAGHERRGAAIARDISREMGYEAQESKRLHYAGLVHDVGKIAIPSDILSKPGTLSPIEYALVKEHANEGYEILKDVRFPFPLAEIIRQHHERIDGSGYPRGLKDGEILPEAKILAVADVVESISSHRPYRPALGLGAAVAELRAQRGVLYDTAVVDAFIGMVTEKGYQISE